MEKFKDKYRIDSNRMPGWDYARGGKYYVTICTGNRVCCFGDVANGEIKLNKMGEIAGKYWREIPTCFSETYLDEYVVMPNHVHGIIVMKRLHRNNTTERPECNLLECRDDLLECRDETRSRLYVPNESNVPNAPNIPNVSFRMAAISPKPGSLSVIIGGWKSKCTKEFKEMGQGGWFAWQPRFYDEIIRNDKRLEQIRAYIRNNPANWDTDDKNPKYIKP